MTHLNYRPVFLAALALLALSCAGAPPDADLETAVKARAAAYWQHRVKGELSKAYLYETPTLREGVSIETYIKVVGGGILYLGSRVQSAVVRGDRAVVTVELTYKPMGVISPKKGLKRDIHDHWERFDGEWYHRFQPSRKKGPSLEF